MSRGNFAADARFIGDYVTSAMAYEILNRLCGAGYGSFWAVGHIAGEIWLATYTYRVGCGRGHSKLDCLRT